MPLLASDRDNKLLAEKIVRVLGGQWFGTSGMACCPAHPDRIPSLSITAKNGRLLVHCFVGCPPENVIKALRARGLWFGQCHLPRASHKEQLPASTKENNTADAERTRRALKIWDESLTVASTLVETYLQTRGISVSVPQSIRFHPSLRHHSGGFWPAMVALVERGDPGEPVGIHRTFLTTDGSKKAPVQSPKMMLGPCRGGAVRLGHATEALLVGEGIETCLSALQETARPTWAALSTSGLHSLDLPLGVHDIVLLADGDDPGEAAALRAGKLWRQQGRRVSIAQPPRGFDFNDVLMGRHVFDSEV